MKHSVPLLWRLKEQKYNLTGNKCGKCETVFFPKRSICPSCRREGKLNDFRLSGLGEIQSFSIINTPPQGFEEMGPYAIGTIKLKEGPVISAQIINKEDIKIGKKVKPVFRKINEDGASGLIHYGIKFEVV